MGEVIVEKPVVTVDREVSTEAIPEIKEVIVEREVIKEVPVEVIKEVEVVKEVIVEMPVEVEVVKEVIKEVEVPVTVIMEVTKEVPVEVVKEVPVEVLKEVEVPVEVIVEKENTERVDQLEAMISVKESEILSKEGEVLRGQQLLEAKEQELSTLA